ncbi:MAG: carboxypeptidase regulatory-like domain-containing protein, partial [Blastocatellia bacterium]|nr:carboxypeptidase regulatory-like domain-containing protein [Blastocatellia bacterium]
MSPSTGARITLIAATIVACAAATGLSQEFRGSITGRVTDNNGAAVTKAAITITNTATNVSSSTATNGDGDYTALYLIPGNYSVTVEAAGFKKSTRQNVEIRVGDRLQIDMRLEVGNVSETVNVNSDAPLLETNSASAGQVIDQRRIADLPLSDGNPFVLSRLSAGVAYVGDLKFSRPFDNSGAAAVITDGSPGKNEFTLDGTPNMAGTGGTNGAGRVAFVPPADAVQEFKIETASYDAQQAHTAAATVNVTLKSGTNGLHGTVYEFVRNDILSGNDFFLNRAGTPRPALHYNRYGFTVGGPIWLPKKIFGPLAYDGRNRSFFFFSLEKLKDVFPEPGLFTVPTQAERNGDFSALLGAPLTTKIAADGNCAGPKGSVVQITNRDGTPALAGQIYNPATAQTVSRCNPLSGKVEARVDRLPFTGNIISSGFSDIAKNFLKFYPLPNLPGDSQGRNNFVSPQPRTDTFNSESYRFDQTLSDKQRFFVRYTHNWRREDRGDWTGVVNGIIPVGNFLFRINNGGSFDHVYDF